MTSRDAGDIDICRANVIFKVITIALRSIWQMLFAEMSVQYECLFFLFACSMTKHIGKTYVGRSASEPPNLGYH